MEVGPPSGENGPCTGSKDIGAPTMTNTTREQGIRELDRRVNDGIDVRLLWNSLADQVVLAVHDTRSDDSFELQVAAADALLAFHHPYAYANRRTGGHVRAA
jgi:hypothetical protein